MCWLFPRSLLLPRSSLFFPARRFSVTPYGGRNSLHCVHRNECVGPPHVHRRHELKRKHVFCSLDDGYRCSHGYQDLQLAGDHVGWKDSFQDTDAVRHRLSLSILGRRSHRDHAERGTLRLAAWEFLLRRRPISLSHRRRHSFHDFWRLLLLVSEDVRKDVQRDAW